MVPKLDDNGDQIPMKVGKRINGKNFREQRVMMDTYQEYYLNNADEIQKIISAFAVNAKDYDFKKFMDADVKDLETAPNPMNLEKATNLEVVE